MDGHFRAFSFVDRITYVHDGRQIHGSYAIPSGVDEFPLALVGEAVGQLAAWAAMAAADFGYRPVAGLAGRIESLRQPRPGQILELAATLENVDTESVEYNGTARVNGTPIINLKDCVGPMMVLTEFEDPQAVRVRFDELCQGVSRPGVFPGLPQLAVERTGGASGQSVATFFRVPPEAPFFADHFPRRAVFPGSLLMHLSLGVATILTGEMAPPAQGRWVPAEIQDMKLRSFIPPGAALQIEARVKQLDRHSASLTLETRTEREMVATASLALRAEETV
jgi:3-hydroxymyristoyl/3-hydroxydecanoyl-(acyl carrier protein) dehydratase